MTKRDYLQELENANLLTIGIRLGVINGTCFIQKEMYDYWFNLCAQGHKSKTAVLKTAIDFDMSPTSVWRGVRSMRENIVDPRLITTT